MFTYKKKKTGGNKVLISALLLLKVLASLVTSDASKLCPL